MSKFSDVRWGRWLGAFAGLLVMLKSLIFVFSRVFRVAKGEVQERGGDVTFVLGLASRRKGGGG